MNRSLQTVFVILSLLVYKHAFSQSNVIIEWQKALGGANSEELGTVLQTPDNGYIVAGLSLSSASADKTENNRGPAGTADYWVVKLDTHGNIRWQKTIGGDGMDHCYHIALTRDSGYILGGTSNSNISGEKSEACKGAVDYWIVKLDTAGNIQWQRTIGSSTIDFLTAIIQTSDGGYMVGGYSDGDITGDKTGANRGTPGAFTKDYWIVKLDAAGATQWQKTVGSSLDDYLWSVIQTSDSGYLLGGYSNGFISGEKSENRIGLGDNNDYWVIKLDYNGNIQWDNTLGGDKADGLKDMVQSADGGYLLVGESESGISGDKADASKGVFDSWIIKLDSLGAIQWQKTYGGNDFDGAYSLTRTHDDGYVISGYSQSGIYGDKTEACNGGADYWVLKLDTLGTIKWQKTLGGDQSDMPHIGYSIDEAIDGSIVIGGSSASDISGNKTEVTRGLNDFWIIKMFQDCPAPTIINALVCSSIGYQLPWDTTVYQPGNYTKIYPGANGSCDSIFLITLISALDTTVLILGDTLMSQTTSATYQWINCETGQPIPGAISSTYISPPGPGSYAVIVTTKDCTDTSNCHTMGTMTNTASPSQIKQSNKIIVYPNPTARQITIASENNLIQEQITIINTFGTILCQISPGAPGNTQIDISQLLPGIYIIHIQTSGGMFTHKLEKI